MTGDKSEEEPNFWQGFKYDLLPKIFEHYDKNLKIHLLRLMVDEHDQVTFNPYTRESLLRTLVDALRKTCRLEEFHYYIYELSQLDNSIDVNAEYEKMYLKTQEARQYCEDNREMLESVYYNRDDDSVPSRDRTLGSNRIEEIIEEYESDGVQYVKIKVMKRAEVLEYPRAEISESINNYLMRNNLPTLYKFSQKLFDLGRTDAAAVFLSRYSNLYAHFTDTFRDDAVALQKLQKINEKSYQQSLWGIICCKLVDGEFSEDNFKVLRSLWPDTTISREDSVPLAVMGKRRAWLLHWNVFQNLLNERAGQTIDNLRDALLEDSNKATIIAICPWLLRYLAFTAICSTYRLGPKITQCSKTICPILEQEVHTYKDPLTEFLRCLFVESDFEAASEHLRECRKVLTVDIFLCSHCNVFFSQARLLLFSRYAMVNMRMDLQEIGKLLMLDKYQEMPDNKIWSIGNQPVHYEKRSLTQWITQTVRELQKEQIRQTSENEDTGRPQYNIRIDLREGMLLTKPTFPNEFEELLRAKREQYIDAQAFADNLR